MTVADLKKELEQYPDDMPVAIVDWQANIADDNGDDSDVGVHTGIEVLFVDQTEDNPSPFLALVFDTNPTSEDMGDN